MGRGSSIISSNIYEKNTCSDSKIFVEVLICVTIMSLSSISGNNYDPLVNLVGEGGGWWGLFHVCGTVHKIGWSPECKQSVYKNRKKKEEREISFVC